MNEDLTPKLNLPPFQTILDLLPSVDMAVVQGGWAQGASQMAQGNLKIQPDPTSVNKVFLADKNGVYLGNPAFASAPFSVDMNGNLIAASATIAGVALSTLGIFGGDGSDGALSISSGTTTINLGGAAVVVKAYSSISITGTGKLAFSNPHANGTIVILKSSGDINLTSSQTPMLDFSSLGGIGAATADTDGTNGISYSITTNKGLKGAGGIGGAGGATADTNIQSFLTNHLLFDKYFYGFLGAGGGGGDTAATAAGTGGRGGGLGYIECAGAWNFTTVNGISVAGANGTNGTNGSALGQDAGSGGGGGAGGCFIALYNTLTANSGTVNISGGTGGNGGGFDPAGTGAGSGGVGGNSLSGGTSVGGTGGNGGGGAAGGGGGGGGSNYKTANGTAGNNGTGNGAVYGGGGGGGGASGYYSIQQNINFA